MERKKQKERRQREGKRGDEMRKEGNYGEEKKGRYETERKARDRKEKGTD